MFVGEGANLLSINHNGTDQTRSSSQCDNEGGSCTAELMPSSAIGDAGSVAFAFDNIDKMDMFSTGAQLGCIAARLVKERNALAELCQGRRHASGPYKLKALPLHRKKFTGRGAAQAHRFFEDRVEYRREVSDNKIDAGRQQVGDVVVYLAAICGRHVVLVRPEVFARCDID
jgi:hypothetical protein